MIKDLNCKKIHFTSKKDVKRWLQKKKGKKVKIYKCKDCNGYHFTSMNSESISKVREAQYQRKKHDLQT